MPVVCEQCALTSPTEPIVQTPRWANRPTARQCELCTVLEKRLDEARIERDAAANSSLREAASRRWVHLSRELSNHRQKGECSTAVTGASRSKFNELAGSHLSSVEFVHDYIQFHFDGPCLTTFTLPSIKISSAQLKATDSGYRDALVSQIGGEVEEVVLTPEELEVKFASSAVLLVSLRDEAYTGPEAINYISKDRTLTVI